jgi:hypothetical protein
MSGGAFSKIMQALGLLALIFTCHLQPLKIGFYDHDPLHPMINSQMLGLNPNRVYSHASTFAQCPMQFLPCSNVDGNILESLIDIRVQIVESYWGPVAANPTDRRNTRDLASCIYSRTEQRKYYPGCENGLGKSFRGECGVAMLLPLTTSILLFVPFGRSVVCEAFFRGSTTRVIRKSLVGGLTVTLT